MLVVQVSHHQASGRQRSERRFLNLNALAAAGRAGELGAQNAGDVLLQVGQIGSELKAESVAAVFRRGPGDGAGNCERDGLAGDVDRTAHRGQIEGELLAVSGEENAHFFAKRKLLALET